MIINKIKIGGFKNIDLVEMSLNNITVLVSQNSYGKSNLMQAIDFGFDFISKTNTAKKRMMSWTSNIPFTKHIASKDFEMEVEMTTLNNKTEFNVIYGYRFRWVRDDKKGAKILDEWLKIKANDKNQKYKQYIDRTEDKILYRTSETGRCNVPITAETDELLVNKIKAYDNLFYIDVLKKINSIHAYVERHLDASRLYDPDPIIRTDIEDFEIENNENLPRMIFNLKEQYPDKYDMLIDSFIQLFPQIIDIVVDKIKVEHVGRTKIPKDLPLKATDQVYLMRVVDKYLNQPIRFENLSDGTKRIFLLLTCIILSDINNLTLIGIEEPENSIHPSLLQSFLRVISQLQGNCKVVMASHSPFIVQYMDLDDVIIGKPNNKGIASFLKIRQSMQKTLTSEANDMDISTGNYIFELLNSMDDGVSEVVRYMEKDNNG
ncbi:MAG: AAA family ATPase [Clostridia bacterium]|nr:AAA family ATPase [Clostridia bacterium]